MITPLGALERLKVLTLRPAALGVVVTAGLLWLAVIAVRAALLVSEPFTLPGRDATRPNNTTPAMWIAVGLIVLSCLVAALLTRRLLATATLPVTFAVGGVVVLAGALGTGSLGSLLLVLGIFALAWLLGDALLCRLRSPADGALVRVPIATALGLGLFGLLLLALATLSALTTATVVGIAGIILLGGLLLRRQQLARNLCQLRSWRPASPSWLETVVLALTVGSLAYAMLAAFTPEVHSDAVRQHLPIAREIWQAGAAPEFPPMWTSRLPVEAHLLYAVAFGLGDMTAAKLVHTGVGLLAILGVAGIAWLGAAPLLASRVTAQRLAAVVAGAVFATMPLVLWELGTAYIDLFPVLFAVASVLAILCWQRDGHLGWLLVAGALAGFGLAAKLTMGLVIVALVVALALVGRGEWQWRERLLSLVAFGVGGLVVVPWLLRGYLLTGTILGPNLLADHAVGTATSDLASFGLGRSPLDFLGIPWHLTFHGELFHQEGAGDIGLLLLLLLPLVLLAPRTRAIAFLSTTIGFAFLAWALTAQLTRYLLPTLALAIALIGICAATTLGASYHWAQRTQSLVVSVGLVVGLAAAPLLLLPKRTAQLPIDLIVGQQTSAQFVAETVPAATALEAASTLLPPDTRVGYFAKWEGAQLYTEARLIYPDSSGLTREGMLIDLDLLGRTAEAVLASLQRLDIDYFIWNRVESRPQDWRSTLLSTPFLRTHTRILAGDRSGYLFELLPQGGSDWGQSQPNLLADPELEHVGTDGPWRVTEPVRTRKGVVSLRPKSVLVQRVPVTAETPYLLLATATCETPADRAVLALRWFDAHAVELGVTEEWVLPGTAGSDQFLWHLAPPRAATVSVELTTTGGARCDVDEAALYASP